VAAIIVWFAGWVVEGLAFVVTQQLFYEESRKTHGAWRPWYDRWLSPNWGELGAMASQTFRRQESASAEQARRRYLAVMGIGVLWFCLGLPVTVLLLGH